MNIKVDVNVTAPQLVQAINNSVKGMPIIPNLKEVNEEPVKTKSTEPKTKVEPKKTSKSSQRTTTVKEEMVAEEITL